MRFVIQRVKEANVKVAGETVGSINKGLLVLIGLTHNDKYSDIEFATNKLLNLRLWDDSKGTRWKESVKSLNLEILLVSQFTLYSILKGNKPDFHNALNPEEALKMYCTFLETLKKNYSGNIQSGRFGKLMEVSLVNDGPVTINWDYPEVKEGENIFNSTKTLINQENKFTKKINKADDKMNIIDKKIYCEVEGINEIVEKIQIFNLDENKNTIKSNYEKNSENINNEIECIDVNNINKKV